MTLIKQCRWDSCASGAGDITVILCCKLSPRAITLARAASPDARFPVVTDYSGFALALYKDYRVKGRIREEIFSSENLFWVPDIYPLISLSYCLSQCPVMTEKLYYYNERDHVSGLILEIVCVCV